jgi:hypothetical protein
LRRKWGCELTKSISSFGTMCAVVRESCQPETRHRPPSRPWIKALISVPIVTVDLGCRKDSLVASTEQAFGREGSATTKNRGRWDTEGLQVRWIGGISMHSQSGGHLDHEEPGLRSRRGSWKRTRNQGLWREFRKRKVQFGDERQK